jgi:hypothetical protein
MGGHGFSGGDSAAAGPACAAIKAPATKPWINPGCFPPLARMSNK